MRVVFINNKVAYNEAMCNVVNICRISVSMFMEPIDLWLVGEMYGKLAASWDPG